MKKLAYILLSVCLLSLTSCRLDSFSVISRGINTVSHCLGGLSLAKTKSQTSLTTDSVKRPDRKSLPSYLPRYSWDSKMLLR